VRHNQQPIGNSQQSIGIKTSGQTLRFRWMKRKDVDAVLAIARNNHPQPMTDEDFLGALRRRNRIAQVAVDNGQIVGYMLYELEKNRIRLLSLVVRQSARRQAIGRKLIEHLISKLQENRRTKIVCRVAERNLDAQLFLRSLQFKAAAILRHYDPVSGDDAYLMRYRVNSGNAEK